MPFGPIHIDPPDPPPADPPPRLPEGTAVTYILCDEDLVLIAGHQDDGVLPEGLSTGLVCPATVTETTGDGRATLLVMLAEDGSATYWALSRPEGTEPGTWARLPTT